MLSDNTQETVPNSVLKFKEFRLYLGLRFFFSFAYQMQAIVIGYYVFHITKDPLALGLIGLCEAIPAIAITMYGGYVADKSEKRALLIKIFLIEFMCSVLLLLVTIRSAGEFISKKQVVLIIYVLVFGIGIARGFFSPTLYSLVARIVPRSLYPQSATWSSSIWQIASIAGPATGGLLYGYCGITVTFTVILVLLAVSFCCIYLLNTYPAVFKPKENIIKSLSEGLYFVFKNKMMLGAMSLDLFSVFFGGAVALLPVFANELLKVGSEGLGIMRATTSAGAVLTMLTMTRFSPMNKPWRNLLIAVTGFGASIICLGLSAGSEWGRSTFISGLPAGFYLCLICLFSEGAFDSVSVIIRSTLMQLLTPDEMRGRVSAVNSMFIGSSNEIGAFESGLTARLMGTVPSVLFGGGMTLFIAGITYLKTKKLLPLKLADIQPPATE